MFTNRVRQAIAFCGPSIAEALKTDLVAQAIVLYGLCSAEAAGTDPQL